MYVYFSLSHDNDPRDDTACTRSVIAHVYLLKRMSRVSGPLKLTNALLCWRNVLTVQIELPASCYSYQRCLSEW